MPEIGASLSWFRGPSEPREVAEGAPNHKGGLVGLAGEEVVFWRRPEMTRCVHAVAGSQLEAQFPIVKNKLSVKMREPRPFG